MKIKILLTVLLSFMIAACHTSNAPILAPETIYAEPGLSVVTSFFNNQQQTIATLYGNAAAINAATRDSGHVAGEEYRLVTWKQKANPLWFGGQINGAVQSIESLRTVGDTTTHYELIKGMTTGNQQTRIALILSLKASPFPGE